jgi:hypothetical protein
MRRVFGVGVVVMEEAVTWTRFGQGLIVVEPISAFQHFGVREVEEASDFGIESFKLPVQTGSRNISAIDHVGGEASGIRESEFRKVRKLSAVDFHES